MRLTRPRLLRQHNKHLPGVPRTQRAIIRGRTITPRRLADGTHIGKPSDDQQNHRKVSGNKLPTSSASPSKSNRPDELANRRERSASEDSVNSHRPASDKSAGAAQIGLARNETVNHSPSNRASSAVRPVVPSLGNVRHRGSNPAIVGGVGSSNARNTGALDGTHMNRKRTGN